MFTAVGIISPPIKMYEEQTLSHDTAKSIKSIQKKNLKRDRKKFQEVDEKESKKAKVNIERKYF